MLDRQLSSFGLVFPMTLRRADAQSARRAGSFFIGTLRRAARLCLGVGGGGVFFIPGLAVYITYLPTIKEFQEYTG